MLLLFANTTIQRFFKLNGVCMEEEEEEEEVLVTEEGHRVVLLNVIAEGFYRQTKGRTSSLIHLQCCAQGTMGAQICGREDL